MSRTGSPSAQVWLLIGGWVFVAASALLFIAIVSQPVFDESNNLPDVLRYSELGITGETIKRHVNPAGPFAYVWIGVIGKFLGGGLWSFRLVNVFSLFALGAVLFHFGQRNFATAASACAVLVNPYLPLASATILTELPSLLALTVGALLWLKGLSGISTPDWRSSAKLIGAGALVGISITGRQYYLAALPAMAIAASAQWQSVERRHSYRTLAAPIVASSLVVAVLPIVVLSWAWGGLTPPGMQANVSYKDFSAALGINPVRPITALLLIGIYAFPILLLQHGRSIPYSSVLPTALLALVVTLLVPQNTLWCIPGTPNLCGPVSGLHIYASARSTVLALAYNGFASFIGLYGLFLLGRTVWLARFANTGIVQAAFGGSFLAFFVAEQFFVGGNIPFYERYILQIAPFIGLTLANDRQFSIGRALIGSFPFLVLGQYRLWRLF
jgi:hypothetical protein